MITWIKHKLLRWKKMKIVVLGWGSLIWNPRDLRKVGEWQTDGPLLPIEFARISRDGQLTLVLFPKGKKVRVLWACMTTNNLKEAIDNLSDVEGTEIERIGFVSLVSGKCRCNVVPDVATDIKQWATKNGVDAVIWTDLPSNFKDKTCKPLTSDNVILYLRNLQGREIKSKAEEYIRKTPAQVRTEFRGIIEERLGWT